MPSARSRLGTRGEDIAAGHLQTLGLRVIERNVRTRYGEVDIVAEDGGTLVFVEVKTRRSAAFGTPEESITPRKRRRLAQLGEQYVQERGLVEQAWRVDVVAITLDGSGPDVRHYRGIDIGEG